MLGQLCEEFAARWLQEQGLQLLERNYRSREGEIDLIMRHGSQLVFVEVRYRRNRAYGSAAETVDFRKQRKLRLCASNFLQQRSPKNFSCCRFDVVAISGEIRPLPGVDPVAPAGSRAHPVSHIPLSSHPLLNPPRSDAPSSARVCSSRTSPGNATGKLDVQWIVDAFQSVR